MKENDILDKKLTDFSLTVRTLCCLKAADIVTVRQLCRKKKTEFLVIRNFGKKTLTELKDFLADHGLDFGMDV